MNKSFFSGHDLMLSMFESFFKSNKCFIEVPYELNGTNSNNMFHILNQSLGGNIYSYHKELVRFAFELIQDKSDLKGLKDCEIIMFHNVKDFGLILNNLTFDDVKNYFEKNDERKQIKEKIVQGHYLHTCAVGGVIRDFFLQENLRLSYMEMQNSIVKFIQSWDKIYKPTLKPLIDTENMDNRNGVMFESYNADISVIITNSKEIMNLSNELVDNGIIDKFTTLY